MDNNRISKDEMYLESAHVMALRGTCLRRNFGAVIVKNDEVISSGYTGAPRGRENCCDLGICIRDKQNIPHGTRYELCLSGDTKILIHNEDINGDESLSSITLKDWADIGEAKAVLGHVNSINTPYIKVDAPISVGVKKMVEVKFLSTKGTLKCTPDHKVLMMKGNDVYKPSGQLRHGDWVMGWMKVNTISLYDFSYIPIIYEVDEVVDIQPEECYDLCVPPTENFAICLSDTDSGIFVHNCRSVHAEMNAIISSCRQDMLGSTLYLYGYDVQTGNMVEKTTCCSMCERMVINAGIERVISYNPDKTINIQYVKDWITDEALNQYK